MPHELRFVPRSSVRSAIRNGGARALNNMPIKAFDGSEFDTFDQLMSYYKLIGYDPVRDRAAGAGAGAGPGAGPRPRVSDDPGPATPRPAQAPRSARRRYGGRLTVPDYQYPRAISNALGGLAACCPADTNAAIRQKAAEAHAEKHVTNAEVLPLMGLPTSEFVKVTDAFIAAGLLEEQPYKNKHLDLVVTDVHEYTAGGKEKDVTAYTVQTDPAKRRMAAEIIAQIAPGFGCPTRSNPRRLIDSRSFRNPR